ncbi:MAG: class II aldolase/adducin family protein [Hyphomicrobiaceae bacterium]
MASLDHVIMELAAANRILAHNKVVDAYGHISVRHPTNPNRFLLSRSRSPELVEPEDIREFGLDGELADGTKDKPYLERYIHAGIYEANPEIMSVVHSHALEVLPFSVSTVPLVPLIHTASHCGAHIPVWDIADGFGDTSLLVTTREQGRDLAKTLAKHRLALMRGHGFAAAGRTLGEVLKVSIYLPQNARVQMDAIRLGGGIKPLSAREIEIRDEGGPGGRELDRAMEYWAAKAGCSHLLPPRG